MYHVTLEHHRQVVEEHDVPDKQAAIAWVEWAYTWGMTVEFHEVKTAA